MKLRTPGTLSEAISEIRSKLSEAKCAKLVGRSTALIRKWADPDMPAIPNLSQSMILDVEYVKLGFGEPPIQNWYVNRLERTVERNPGDAINIVTSALHAQAALGHLSSMIAQFTEPNSEDGETFSSNERAALLGIIEKLTLNLDKMEIALRDTIDLPESVSLAKIPFK